MKKKLLLIIIPLIILIGGAAGASYYIYDNTVNIDTFYPGVKIEDFDLEGMTKEEAREHIASQLKAQDEGKAMKLSYGEDEYTVSLEDIDYKYDIDSPIEEAYKLGRNKKPLERYKEVKNLEKEGISFPIESSYKVENINQIAKRISEELYIESKDSTFSFNGGKFAVTEDVVGQEVDEKELAKSIEDNIEDLKDLEIPVKKIEPKYSKEYYSRINGLIGQASTEYSNSIPARKENIRLSTLQFNGRILHPGDSLSYNATVGNVSTATGYKVASVIINGEFVDGVGGGICQTSTTLYNALLQADLSIVQRSPHSIPISYVPKGTDAAVAAGSKDLIFKNDFDFPVYINATSNGSKVYFRIYGDKNVKNYDIKIESKVTDVIKHKVKENLKKDAAPGSRELVQTGRDGYKAVTYKYKIRNGKVFDSKHITSDYYREQTAIYNVGPPKPKAEKPKEEKPKENPKDEEKGEDKDQGEKDDGKRDDGDKKPDKPEPKPETP